MRVSRLSPSRLVTSSMLILSRQDRQASSSQDQQELRELDLPACKVVEVPMVSSLVVVTVGVSEVAVEALVTVEVSVVVIEEAVRITFIPIFFFHYSPWWLQRR